MTLRHLYDGTLLTNRIQLVEEKGFSTRAVLGEADTIHVVVDDPLLALTILGRKVWKMVEDTCPVGNQVVWRGVTGVKRISRGSGSATFPFGRRWIVELIEDNVRLGRRAITVPQANRPAETVSARLTWLLTTPGYSGLIVDRGLVEASSVMLDAVDYTNRTGADVLRDLATESGFNFFARYRELTDDLELAFRDDDTSQLDTSTLRISNAGDEDLITTWPSGWDAELEQSPERKADEVVLPYTGGTVVRPATLTASPDDVVSLVAPTAAVKTAATATILADRLLDQHDSEDERIPAIRIVLPAANLNDVKPGHLIQAKLTHLPGFETYRPCRVLSKSFGRPDGETQAFYDVDLALSPALPPIIIQQVSAQNGHAGFWQADFPDPVTGGTVLLVVQRKRNMSGGGGMPLTIGWGSNGTGPTRDQTVLGTAIIRAGDIAGPDQVRIGWFALDGSEGAHFWIQANEQIVTLYEIGVATITGAEVLALSSQGPSGTKTLGTFTTAHAADLQVAGFVWDATTTDQTAAAGWTIDNQVYYENPPGHPGSLSMTAAIDNPTVRISGGSYEWGAVGVNIPRP